MRALKASAGYFALVFTVGFVLGVIRISLLVPALGVRWAELLELPVMLLACYWAARYFVGRYGPFSAGRRLGIGMLALALLLTAEVVLTIALDPELPKSRFASAQEAAPLHVPGVPMTFPVDAASALDHLGRSLLINCETDDLAVKNSCVQGIEERM